MGLKAWLGTGPGSGDPDDRSAERDAMVAGQIAGRGVNVAAVLEAMRAVPRHRFVPESARPGAYRDHPLPIGFGQTISQPYMVGLMSAHLDVKPGMRVLEIGTGSGYQAAILAALGAEVYSVERIAPLSERAAAAFAELGIATIRLKQADGTLGWPEEAPFERIVVTAGAPDIPPSLKGQLAPGGKMVIPVGEPMWQSLKVIERESDGFREKDVCACVFVKLKGEEGWRA